MLRSVLRCVACVHTAHTRTTDVLPPQLFPASSAARLIVSRPLNVRLRPPQLPIRYDQDTIAPRQSLERAIAPGHVSGAREFARRASAVRHADFRDVRDL